MRVKVFQDQDNFRLLVNTKKSRVQADTAAT